MKCKKGFEQKNGKCVKRKGLIKKLPKGRNLSFTIILAVISVIIIGVMANLIVNEFLVEPNYSDYCDVALPDRESQEQNQCYQDFDAAEKHFNQTRFYIFAGVGLTLIILGLLYAPNLLMQLTGLGAGGVLVAESAILNFENTTSVLIVLGAVLVLIIFFGMRRLEK